MCCENISNILIGNISANFWRRLQECSRFICKEIPFECKRRRFDFTGIFSFLSPLNEIGCTNEVTDGKILSFGSENCSISDKVFERESTGQ